MSASNLLNLHDTLPHRTGLVSRDIDTPAPPNSQHRTHPHSKQKHRGQNPCAMPYFESHLKCLVSLAMKVVPGVIQFESNGVAVTVSPAFDALSSWPLSCCAALNRRARCCRSRGAGSQNAGATGARHEGQLRSTFAGLLQQGACYNAGACLALQRPAHERPPSRGHGLLRIRTCVL